MFDFNGTLSQDEPVLCAIYRELFAEHGRPITDREYYGRLAGLAEEAIVGGWLGRGPAHPRSSPSGSTATADGRGRVDGGRATRDAVRYARRACRSPSSRAPFAPRSSPSSPRPGSESCSRPSSPRTTSRAASRTRRATCSRSRARADAPASARLRGHRGGRRVRQGGRAARGRRARHAGARAARAGRRARRHDRRRRCCSVCSDDLGDRPPRRVCGAAREHAAAFERAIELGADFVEFDVHAARDGALVVCHDPPRGGEPRLEQVVELCAGRIGMMCELKTPWRYRRHDVVARDGSATAGGRRRRLVRAAGARAGARAADAAARRLRRLDPSRRALRLGRRLLRPARPAGGGSRSPARSA